MSTAGSLTPVILLEPGEHTPLGTVIGQVEATDEDVVIDFDILGQRERHTFDPGDLLEVFDLLESA